METQIQQIFEVLHEGESDLELNNIIVPFIHSQDLMHLDNFSSIESQRSVENQLSTLLIYIIQEHLKRLDMSHSIINNVNLQFEELQDKNRSLHCDILELNYLVSHQKDQIRMLYRGIEESESTIDQLREKIKRLQNENFSLNEHIDKLEEKKEPPSLIELKHSKSLIELERFKNDNDQLEIENLQLKEHLYNARVEIAQLSSRHKTKSENPSNKEDEQEPFEKEYIESLDHSKSDIEVVKKLSFDETDNLENGLKLTQEDTPPKEVVTIVDEIESENKEIDSVVPLVKKNCDFEAFINETPAEKEASKDPIIYKGSNKSTRNNSDSITTTQKEELLAIIKSTLTINKTEPISIQSHCDITKKVFHDIAVQTEKINLAAKSSGIFNWRENLKYGVLLLLFSILSFNMFINNNPETSRCGVEI